MPALACNAGKLTVIYYDLREDTTLGIFTQIFGTGLFSETRQPVGDLAAPSQPDKVFTNYIMDAAPRNPTMIMGPSGELKAPVLAAEEGIAYADIDLEDCVIPKQFHDLAGYMNRFDIFNLTVDRSTNDPVTFSPPRGGARRAGSR